MVDRAVAYKAVEDTFGKDQWKMEDWFSDNVDLLFSVLEDNAAQQLHDKLRSSRFVCEMVKMHKASSRTHCFANTHWNNLCWQVQTVSNTGKTMYVCKGFRRPLVRSTGISIF